MKTIDLTTERAGVEEIFRLAEQHDLFVRSADGKMFIVAEFKQNDAADDFTDEVALTRQHRAIRELLTQRSQEPGVYSSDEVRQKLGLASRSR